MFNSNVVLVTAISACCSKMYLREESLSFDLSKINVLVYLDCTKCWFEIMRTKKSNSY